MIAVVTRITLRYAAGLLVAKGLLAPELGTQLSADPDIAAIAQVLIGGAFGVLAEAWYYLARRFGLSK